jgi:hypothetical protein
VPVVGSQNRALAGQSAEVTHVTQACRAGSHLGVTPEQSASAPHATQIQAGDRQIGVALPQVRPFSPQAWQMPSSQAVPVGQGNELAVSHVGTQRPLAQVSVLVQSAFATQMTQRCSVRLQCG